MKKTNLFSGSVALATLALVACSNELPNNSGPEVAEKDEIRYVRISITNPPSTRAEGDSQESGNTGTATNPEFSAGTNGTKDENEVKDIYFIFYDNDGNVVGNNSIVDMTTDPFTDNTGNPTPSVGKIATTVLQLQIPKGSKKPAYVMAFLNPVNYSEVSDQENMNDLRNSIRTRYLCDHGCFAMNNSAYYGNNPITGASNVKMLGAPVLEGRLYTSKDDAEKSDAAAIDIYVERYAAKVNFRLDDKQIDDQNIGTDDNKYVLTYVPEYWTINADAPSMYASKRFETSDANDNLVPTYDQVQATLGTWTKWNDAPNYRSYWACSPGYYASKSQFPTVSDDIIDYVMEYPFGSDSPYSGNTTGAGAVIKDSDGKNKFALLYYSYNQITKDSNVGVKVAENNASNCKYVLENTMGPEAFGNTTNPKAAAPSVVIVGHYEIKKGGTTTIEYTPGFCLYTDGLYYIDGIPTNDANAQTIKKAMMNRNGILAIDKEGTLLTYDNAVQTDAQGVPADMQGLRQFFKVVHPSLDVRGVQKLPHRYVTLQLDQNADLTSLFYKNPNTNQWTQVTKDDVTQINKLLWAQLGNARIYTQNKGYFSIPIQHLRITEDPVASVDERPIAPDGSINWGKVRVGDFGLVRNHVYTLEVSAIQGLASGIDNLDNPLVPAMEEDDYWVKYKINILNWRVVPAQSGIVLK